MAPIREEQVEKPKKEVVSRYAQPKYMPKVVGGEETHNRPKSSKISARMTSVVKKERLSLSKPRPMVHSLAISIPHPNPVKEPNVPIDEEMEHTDRVLMEQIGQIESIGKGSTEHERVQIDLGYPEGYLQDDFSM